MLHNFWNIMVDLVGPICTGVRVKQTVKASYTKENENVLHMWLSNYIQQCKPLLSYSYPLKSVVFQERYQIQIEL